MAGSNRWENDLSQNSDSEVVSSSNIVLEIHSDNAEFGSINNDILKSVLAECWTDWECHRRICYLSHSQFAKHLLSFHNHHCADYCNQLANNGRLDFQRYTHSYSCRR